MVKDYNYNINIFKWRKIQRKELEENLQNYIAIYTLYSGAFILALDTSTAKI